MKKGFVAIALLLFVGTVATPAFASTTDNTVKTEKKKDDKKKKKTKKGASCSGQSGTGSGSCCQKKAA